ncbi:hypothetical protein DEO72_LG3g1059 [Vigna unguiculata]|uniref:Uncharacterized protein n=1 Tax=Vigna unguiculata TaxID=3917 RepID=A0A4D6LDQ3_VIGUN|nr:hypothetical protein DEO72_LG3g1059 [Vigna unguiculata]
MALVKVALIAVVFALIACNGFGIMYGRMKVELPTRPDKGKDLKKVKVALLRSGSSSGGKGPESGLIELPETSVRKDIDINLRETIINSIDSIEPDHLVRTMVEFGSNALILSRPVGSLYRWEVKEGNREKVEELQGKFDKFAEERAAWKKRKEGWEEEKKRLGTWKIRCLDSEGKLNKRITNLEVDYDNLKEKYEGVEVKLDDLKGCIIREHINGSEGIALVNEAESSPEEEVEKEAAEEEKEAEITVEGGNDKAK